MAWTQKCTVALFCNSFFKRSHFIRVPIPSAPNKWTAFSDTKLIARLAMGCHAGQALLSQWKCNLCGANEEELPCDDSYTQHWKEHVALKSAATFWQITSLQVQHNAFYALWNQVSFLICHASSSIPVLDSLSHGEFVLLILIIESLFK